MLHWLRVVALGVLLASVEVVGIAMYYETRPVPPPATVERLIPRLYVAMYVATAAVGYIPAPVRPAPPVPAQPGVAVTRPLRRAVLVCPTGFWPTVDDTGPGPVPWVVRCQAKP